MCTSIRLRVNSSPYYSAFPRAVIEAEMRKIAMDRLKHLTLIPRTEIRIHTTDYISIAHESRLLANPSLLWRLISFITRLFNKCCPKSLSGENQSITRSIGV